MNTQERKIKEGLKLLIIDLLSKAAAIRSEDSEFCKMGCTELAEDAYVLAQRTGYLTESEVKKLREKYQK